MVGIGYIFKLNFHLFFKNGFLRMIELVNLPISDYLKMLFFETTINQIAAIKYM